jgi:single-strand DNA-binding protein
MNSVNLIGRLSRDIELKYTSTNMAIATTSIAVSKGKDKAIFINLKAFDKKAENMAKFFLKGSQVGITGKIDVEEWEKDGKKNQKVVIIVDDFTFAEAKKVSEAYESPSPSRNASTPLADVSTGFYALNEDDQDLPF